jgi:hypothetical protein
MGIGAGVTAFDAETLSRRDESESSKETLAVALRLD